MSRVYWTAEAIADRHAVYDYIEADNPAAAVELDTQFDLKAAMLLSHPRMGRKGRVDSTYERVVHPNYILVYDIAGEDIRILRLLHAARLWPPE